MRIVRVKWSRCVAVGAVVVAAVQTARLEQRGGAAVRAHAPDLLSDLPCFPEPGERGCWRVEDYELSSGRLAMTIVREPSDEPPEPPSPRDYVLEIYDVQDLLVPVGDVGCGPVPVDDLLAILEGLSGGPDAWREPASLEVHRGQLIVNQTARLQQRLRALLAGLRRTLARVQATTGRRWLPPSGR